MVGAVCFETKTNENNKAQNQVWHFIDKLSKFVY